MLRTWQKLFPWFLPGGESKKGKIVLDESCLIFSTYKRNRIQMSRML